VQLVGQADAAAFLAQIEQHAFPLCSIICMAVESCSPQSQRPEPKTSPVRHSLCTRTSTGSGCTITLPSGPKVADAALAQRQVRLGIDHALIGVQRENAPARRQRDALDPLDELLALQA
jgi:hypothetical protein